MIENKNIIINNIVILKNIIYITGYKKNSKINIAIKADSNEIEVLDDLKLDRTYVGNKVLDKDKELFEVKSVLPKNTKKIEILVNNKTLKELEVDNYIQKKNILRTIKRIFNVIGRTIKLTWERHHFLVPPRMLKQYLTSFKNNMKSGNINELFYEPTNTTDYNNWLKENEHTPEYKKLKYNPLFSVVIPTYNVSRKLLTECINSVLDQSYENFEICISDDSSTLSETIETLKGYESNPKIKINYRTKNGHISENTNSAIKLATGDFIALLDNDDILSKDALYYMALKLNEDKDLDLIYSDEDKLNFEGVRMEPDFKPDYSKDLLLSTNYFCHLVVFRKDILNKTGLFRTEYNGAQDYDLFLRIASVTNKIGHINKILYHWRMIEGSTSSGISNKNYALDAGKKALLDYFKKNNIKALVRENLETNRYDIEYILDKEPKISIIIPTKDKSDVLDTCLKSIYEKTNYKNYEIIVIDNNSEEDSTFELLKKYENEHKNFKSYRYECPFNYSYLNNEGVKKATGEYIVLLNNDTEVITPDWLKLMVGYASQKHVGCVGAKLLYPNRTIQHAGVIIGLGGIGTHAYVTVKEDEVGYFARLKSVYDWSCVTAACLMISKEKFELVNGLEEKLTVAYNDVDFNLKMLEEGLYNVVLPQVKLFHYESLSRGYDNSGEKFKRFKRETDYMCDKWKEKILFDRFYNDNFTYRFWFKLDRSKENE